MIKFHRAVLALVAILQLAACETTEPGIELINNTDAYFKSDPQILLDAGATRLSADEARAHISGNTELWDEGPVYYDPDGKLEMIWRKVRSRGSWEISEDGEICKTTPTWSSCHYYLAQDGKITTIDRGKVNDVLVVKPGKKLQR